MEKILSAVTSFALTLGGCYSPSSQVPPPVPTPINFNIYQNVGETKSTPQETQQVRKDRLTYQQIAEMCKPSDSTLDRNFRSLADVAFEIVPSTNLELDLYREQETNPFLHLSDSKYFSIKGHPENNIDRIIKKGKRTSGIDRAANKYKGIGDFVDNLTEFEIAEGVTLEIEPHKLDKWEINITMWHRN